MKKNAISVTEAARNFADCVNRVHYQKVSYLLLKNGAPVARLVPHGERVCTGSDLAEILKNIELPVGEAKAWHRDLQSARRKLKAPADKWQ